jgi:type I restriction enzyme S subunit
MKTGWQKRKLAEVLDVQNGYAFDSKGFNSTLGMPLVRIRSLKAGTETETRFSGEYDEKYIVKAGDFLIGMDGEFGCYEWKGEPALLNQRVCRLQGFAGTLDPRFLFYGVNSHLRAIEDVTGYTTVKHLSSKQILDIEFPVPPLQQQQRIVGILDQAFESIAIAIANTEKNLQSARAIFEAHLHSVFTQRSKEWKQKPLAELCESSRVITYGVIKLGDEVPSGVPCLRTSNVRWLHIETKGMKRIAPALSSEYSRTILKGGEVLVNVRGTLGGVAVVSPEMAGWNVSREVAVVPVDSTRINPEFVSYLIGSGTSQKWLSGKKKGAAYVGINIEDLRLLPVDMPDMAEQREIVGCLQVLRNKTQLLSGVYERKLAALEALKKSLLHRAFTGAL